MIAPKTGIAARPHRVTLQNPSTPISDGDGGFIQTWTDLSPASMSAEIKPATAQDLERVTAGTVLATATHVVTMPFHAGVKTTTRIIFNGRTFNVTGVANPEERSIETIAVCVEIVQ